MTSEARTGVGDDLRAGSASAPGPALVGRDAELAVLREALPGAGDGARAVLVAGAPGVGKTALLAAAFAAARPVPVRVAVAEPDHAPGVPARLLVPELDGVAEPATATRRRRHWAKPVLAALAQGPLVLVVEQVDRADGESLAWIDHLMRRAARLPLLVLLSRRTRTVPRAPGPLAELTTRASCRTLELDRLDPAATRELLRTLGTGALDEETVRACAELAMGVPRIVGQLAAELREVDDATVLARLRRQRHDAIRRRARGAVAAAPPHVAGVVRALAVLGAATSDLLAAVADVGLPDVAAALDALAGEHVLEHDPAAGTVALRSPAMREGALDDLDADALVALRRTAARRLSDSGASAEEVAAQLLRIPPASAGEGWMRQLVRMAATEVSLRDGAAAVAAHVEWLTATAPAREDGDPAVVDAEPGRYSDLDADLARSWALVDAHRAVTHLTDALSVAAPRTRVALAVELALCLAAGGRAPAGAAVLRDECERWRRASVSTPDDPLLAVADVVLDHLTVTRVSVAPDPATRTGTTAPLRGSTVAVTRAVAMRGHLSCLRADRTPAEAALLGRQVLTGLPDVPAGTVVLAATVLALAGAAPEAGEAYATALASSRADDGEARTLPFRAAFWHLERGDVTGALRVAGLLAPASGAGEERPGGVLRAEAVPPRTRVPGEQAVAPLARAATLFAADRPDLGARWLDLVEDAVDDAGDLRTLGVLRSRVALVRGDEAEAERVLVRGTAIAAEAGLRNPVDVLDRHALALLRHERGRPAEAWETLDEIEDLVRGWPTDRARGLAGMVRGALEGGMAGIATLTDAVALLTDDGSGADATRARVLLGRLLADAGHARDARSVLREAVEESVRCGAAGLARRARDLLVIAGGRMRSPTGDRLDALTSTERRVAELVAAGASNRDVATELVVTLRTVEQHLTNAYRKLGVAGRHALEHALDPGRDRRSGLA